MTKKVEHLELPIAEIIPNPDNPRFINETNFEKLKKSVTDFKVMLKLRPIVVDENNMILGGNMRYKALEATGAKKASVIKAEGLTKREKEEFIIKDNIESGQWDWDIIANEWEEEKLLDWGLDLPGTLFTEDGEVDDDGYEIPEEIETDIKLGDIFQIGEHVLMCGDACNKEHMDKLLPEADIVITDPPYNVDYTGGTKDSMKIQNDKMQDDSFAGFLNDSFTLMAEKTKPGGAWYIWHSDTYGHTFRKAFIELQ